MKGTRCSLRNFEVDQGRKVDFIFQQALEEGVILMKRLRSASEAYYY